ncbi:MAG: sigma-70 family RNA polymerase sigma factor [Anaerolineae bacterium]|nr:sigma-70 family RNA polymerase sigma factor [Anaerolineae bacterium]
MSTPTNSPMHSHVDFEAFMQDIRPELHRYATRMTGSVIDGEDVVQEALIKANASFSSLTSYTNLRSWLFKITHNKAIDYLRRNSTQPMELLDDYPLAAEPDLPLEDRELATMALAAFLKLVPSQRSCVILKDVMGYSLAEIAECLDSTVPQTKATLHWGRVRLRELAQDVEVSIPALNSRERDLLARYIDRFNARDFDAVRDLLADEVLLEVHNRTTMRGVGEVSKNYFRNYGQHEDWRLGFGLVEGRPAILVYDPRETSPVPDYFMLLTWDDTQVIHIHDYRYARYVMRDASIRVE